MERFPRYKNVGYGLLCSAFAAGMIIFAAKDLFPLDLGDGPLWTKIFVVIFMSCWFGLLGGFALYGLTWLQTIEIDREEIRACYGRFVVRRIPVEKVKTVGISVQYSKNSISLWELVLSEEDRYALNERGEKYLKRGRVRRWMRRASVSAEGRDAAARACLFWRRRGILLRMERTDMAEAALRKSMPGAVFLLDT